MDVFILIDWKELGIREGWGYLFFEEFYKVIFYLRRGKIWSLFLIFFGGFFYVSRWYNIIVLVF